MVYNTFLWSQLSTFLGVGLGYDDWGCIVPPKKVFGSKGNKSLLHIITCTDII